MSDGMVVCWVGLAYRGVAGSLAGRFWCFRRCMIDLCMYNGLDCIQILELRISDRDES